MVEQLKKIQISADTAAKAATTASDGIKVAADASKVAARYSKVAAAAVCTNLVTSLVTGGGGGGGGGLDPSKLPKGLQLQDARGGHWNKTKIVVGAYELDDEM